MIKNYAQFKSYQESYRTIAISDNSLKRNINAMLPMFLLVDSKNSTLDHLLFNECIISHFRESKGLLCPLCDSHLEDYDNELHAFKCLSCNILFNSFDNKVNSSITSYLYNTMKETDCQEKNQIFEENIQNNLEVTTKQLESEELEKQEIFSSNEVSLPTFLHKNEKTKKERHYLYDVTILEHLAKAPKGQYVCPICDSGTGENKSGALSYDSKGNYFHCFSCDCVLSPIDKVTRETVALHLNEVTNTSKQEQKDAFQENIETFYHDLQEQDLVFNKQEKQAFIERTFSNRGFSSEVLNYVMNNKDMLVANDNQYPEYKRLYVTVYASNLQDIIGFQKLSFTDEKGLAKYFVECSSKGFTYFSNPNHPNCCFIVESVTNALAIYECGYNALCCYTKGEEQPYKAYQFALQNGLKPILFLDRDVLTIDPKYISINWLVNIEPFIGALKLKRNADASDLLVLERQFLCDLLRNAYTTYYKKQCYSQETLEQAFQSEARLNIIQAQVGNGKTTLAITNYKNALNPLYSVYTKDATEEVGDRLIEELAIEANVVNSDCPIITDDKHGIITTHERLSKTTQLEDYAIYGDKPIDVAFIDEMHKFFIEQNKTIVQPYYTTLSNEDVKDYIAIDNNQNMTKYVKDGLDLQVLAYKQNDNRLTTSPIVMPTEVSATDVRNNKLQDVYLDRKYTVRELVDPKNYDTLIEGTTNIYAKKIDSNLAYWLKEYTINASFEDMLNYNYDEMKEKLKAEYPKFFNSIRNICLPLALAFFRNCYLVCAFPIRKSDNKALSFDEWQENTRHNVEIKDNNNRSIYFKIQLRYQNLQPLVNIINKAKRVFLFGASDFTYKESLLNEFSSYFGNNFKYFNLAPLGKKELQTSLLKLKKIEDKDIAQILKGISSLECNAVLVTTKVERAKDVFKHLKSHKINGFTFFKDDCFTSFFSDTLEYITTDNKAKEKPFKDIVVYANSPILESSNKLENYTLMLLDCNIFKPTIEYANPYLQDLGVTITEQLKTKLIQIIGRLYRQKGHRIVIVLMNHSSVEFDIVSFLKEKSEVVNVYEDSKNFTYYNNPKDFVANIQRALQGQEMTKYKITRYKALTTEEKEQRKQERQEKKQAKVIEMVAKGATERDIKTATHDYKEYSEQETLAYNKRLIFDTHKPQSASPFNEDILNSSCVCFDTEVFPNAFVINFHDSKGNGYGKVINKANLDYEWLKHFVRLPLFGFNNANYDNMILYKALNLLAPNSQATLKDYDFNKFLKEFSNSIIEDKEHDKAFWQFRKRAYAIGIGDSREMIVKNIQGKADKSIKAFMLDLGLTIKETPYSFETILSDEQLPEVQCYCENDSKAVYLLLEKYKGHFQTSKQLAEQAGLNGNYPKISLLSEIIYNKELTKKQRLNYNPLNINVLLDKSPNFKIELDKKGNYVYVNEFEDYKYILGEGGFNLLPENVLKKDAFGNWQHIESNNGYYEDVTSLDIDSMHPNSAIQVKYFGDYTKYYKAILHLKELCSSDKGFEYIKAELAKHGYEVNSMNEVKERKALFKLILNSTYGNTCIKDKKTGKAKPSALSKCVHNIIALYGSKYSTDLHHALLKEFPNIAIVQMKTDSIKIANCTEDYIKFCNNFAKGYGYTYKIEDVFKYFACKGNEYIAINSKGELVRSINSDEQGDNEDIEIGVKGSSFRELLYDDRGVLRTTKDLRSLLITCNSKSNYKLGTKQTIGKNTIIDYVADVKSHKIQYFLPMIEESKEGLYPFYENKNGAKCSVKGFTSQKVIAIYDLKDLESIDLSMIDYNYYKNNVLKALDIILDVFLTKREPEIIAKVSKQNCSNRIKMKLPYLNEKELVFFNTIKAMFEFK